MSILLSISQESISGHMSAQPAPSAVANGIHILNSTAPSVSFSHKVGSNADRGRSPLEKHRVSLTSIIRSPLLSSNRFQSKDFAGNPHLVSEEVRQGVDGGRRTVGRLLRCRWRVRWSSWTHDPAEVWVRVCHRRPWTRTAKDGVRPRDEEGSRRVDKVGEKRGTGEVKREKVRRRGKGRDVTSRSGPVKWYPKRTERRRARGSAQLQLPFLVRRVCAARESRAEPPSFVLSLSNRATAPSTSRPLLSSFDARAPAYDPPPSWLILWRAPILINAKLRHRAFPRFEAPRRSTRVSSVTAAATATAASDTVFHCAAPLRGLLLAGSNCRF